MPPPPTPPAEMTRARARVTVVPAFMQCDKTISLVIERHEGNWQSHLKHPSPSEEGRLHAAPGCSDIARGEIQGLSAQQCHLDKPPVPQVPWMRAGGSEVPAHPAGPNHWPPSLPQQAVGVCITILKYYGKVLRLTQAYWLSPSWGPGEGEVPVHL